MSPLLDLVPKGAVLYADRLTPAWPAATVLHSDGHWHPATILAWCRHRGGWATLIRWPEGHRRLSPIQPRPPPPPR